MFRKCIKAGCAFLRAAWVESKRLDALSRQPRLEVLEDRLAPAAVQYANIATPKDWNTNPAWVGAVVPGAKDTAVFARVTSTPELSVPVTIDKLLVRSLGGANAPAAYTTTLDMKGQDLTATTNVIVLSATAGANLTAFGKGKASDAVFILKNSVNASPTTLTAGRLEVGLQGAPQKAGPQNKASMTIGYGVTVSVGGGETWVGGDEGTTGTLIVDEGTLRGSSFFASGVGTKNVGAADATQIFVRNSGEIFMSRTLTLGIGDLPQNPATVLDIGAGTVTAKDLRVGFSSSGSVIVRSGGNLSTTDTLVVGSVYGGKGTLGILKSGIVSVGGTFTNTNKGTTLVQVGGILSLKAGGTNNGTLEVADMGVMVAEKQGLINKGKIFRGTAKGAGAGVFGIQGDFAQQADGTLALALGAAGSDEFHVTGTAALDGTLGLSTLVGFNGGVGSTYTVVHADGGLTGTFLDDPDGSTVMVGGYSFVIHYVAGHDVVLTESVAPPYSQSIAGTVWDDASNANGLRDQGEPGVAGVAVNLLDGGGTLLASAVSAAGGGYSFTLVPPGAYSVQFVAPAGEVFTTPAPGGSAADPLTGLTGAFAVTPGQSVSLDAGLVADPGPTAVADSATTTQDTPVSVAVLVNDIGPSLAITAVTAPANGTATINDNGTPTDPTDDYVVYTPNAGTLGTDTFTYTVTDTHGVSATATVTVDVTPAPAPATLAGTVWLDANGDGLDQPTEAAAAGVWVYLLDGTGAYVDGTQTDASGDYQFTAGPGTYQVEVDPPSGYALSPEGQGSAFDPATGLSAPVTLSAGQVDDAFNAGLVELAPTSSSLTGPQNASPGQILTFTFTDQVFSMGGTTPLNGPVDFYDGSDYLGSSPLTQGMVGATATFQTSLPVGDDVVTAVFSGDPTHGGSSASQSVSVRQQTVSVGLSGGTYAPSAPGVPLTFVASVWPTNYGGGTPTGDVTFFDAATGEALGTVAVSPGLMGATASLTVDSLALGTHDITASYDGSDAYQAAASNVVVQVVQQAAVYVGISADQSTATAGATVYLTATVSPQTYGVGVPTGEVTFIDVATGAALGSAVVTPYMNTGTAVLAVSNLAAGWYSIQAQYQGDATYSGAASGSVGLTITAQPAQVATTTTVSSSSPTASLNQAVTLTATVSPAAYGGSGAPGGTVLFTSGSTILGSAIVTGGYTGQGQATITLSSLAVGSYPVVAVYQGDPNYLGSTSPAITQVIVPATPPAVQVSLWSGWTDATVGSPVTFTASLSYPSSTPPSGIITFLDGSTVLGTVAVGGGMMGGEASLTVPFLSAGAHAITATYSGDGNYPAASSPAVTETVEKAGVMPWLHAAGATPSAGQPFTLLADLFANAPGVVPTGSVAFEDNGVLVATVLLGQGSGGPEAAWASAGLAAGQHAITATYAGDANFYAANTTLTLYVNG